MRGVNGWRGRGGEEIAPGGVRAPSIRPTSPCMRGFFTVLLFLAMAATLGVLFAGLIGLARGSDPARSNRLMRWRVILQGVALLLLLVLLSLWRQ